MNSLSSYHLDYYVKACITGLDLAVQPVRFWPYQFSAVVLKETWKNGDIDIHYTLAELHMELETL